MTVKNSFHKDYLGPIFLKTMTSTLLFAGTNADIMKVGGYKLSALEIEAILLEARKSYISQTSIVFLSNSVSIALIIYICS